MADQFLIESPYVPFTISNQFKSVSNGQVYIGEVDKDPLNPLQRIDVYVVNESGENVLVSQPLELNAGGFPVYNGQVSKFITLQPYSMVVLNRIGGEEWRVDNIAKGDPDNIRYIPLVGPEAVCNGVNVDFDVAGKLAYPESAYRIYLDGVRQFPLNSVTGERRWGISGVGRISFTVAPANGVQFSSDLYAPVTSGDTPDSGMFIQDGVGAVPVTVASKLGESASLKDYGALGVEAQDATAAFINACNSHSAVYLIDGTYTVRASEIPATAKVRKIFLQNATLRLEDGQFDFYVAGQHLDIDLTAGGIIHCGLRKTIASSDVAVGDNIIPCYDTSEIQVGQTIATSFQAVGAIGGSKWTNSIRVAGDEFNTVTAKTANSITVQFPVGAAGTNTTNALWKNMVLGNANFNRAGLRFNGYGKVTIHGGEIKEALSGYYLSTEGDDIEGGLIVESHYVAYSGQFLDGFRIAGNSSFLAYGGSMIGSYDYAKQLFVVRQFSGHNIRLESVKVHRGNNDLDFYSFDDAGGKIGLVELIDCDFYGTWTLPIAKDQVNTITGQALNAVYAAQDSLHVWTCELLKPTPPSTVSLIDGFIAKGCTFNNYRRSVAGTTYINYARDFLVDNFIMRDCVFNESSPFYISVNNANKFNIVNKEISNAIIKRNIEGGSAYPLGYYNGNNGTSFLHHTGATVYDNNGGTIANVLIPANINFESLELKGTGDALMTGGGAVVKRLIVDTVNLQLSGNFNQRVPTEITKTNGGTTNGFIPYEIDVSSYNHKRIKFPKTTTSAQILRAGVDITKTSLYITITMSGFRVAGGTYGINGVILANVKTDGAPSPVNMPAAFGYTNNLAVAGVAYWAGNAMSNGFSMANGFFSLSVVDGNLVISNTISLAEDIELSVTIIGG